MALNDRENYLKAARFEGPEWIPTSLHVNESSWFEYGTEMEEVVLRHPRIWPGYKKGDGPRSVDTSRIDVHEKRPDRWGAVWELALDGLEGVVVDEPLADWSAFEGLQAPDPMKGDHRRERDWDAELSGIEEARLAGRTVSAGVDHGFFFMRLYYLRGFERLMMDLATEDERLPRLVQMVEDFNMAIVRRFVAAGVDVVDFGEDLGTQTSSMISPDMFSRWVTPSYTRLFTPAREAGMLVHLHSDGMIMGLMDEFEKAGVDIINPQDLVNGIDNLEKEVKGRFCIRLDIDRQKILPFGEPSDVRDLIEEEVRKLGSPEGGLMFVAGIYPPTPPRNVDALASACEEFMTYWQSGFLAEGMAAGETGEIEKRLSTGRPWGTERFVAGLEKRLGRELTWPGPCWPKGVKRKGQRGRAKR